MAEIAEGSWEVKKMDKRPARTRTEIDFLPPFGEPEVITTGKGATDAAVAAIAVGGAVSYFLNN